METVKEKPMKLYAVRDKATGKLVSNITNPSRKYWDREGNCKNAISTAKRSGSDRGRELEMVEFTLVENYDERQIASAQQEWVSVDERLPEETGKYIVCTAKNTVYLAKYYSNVKHFGIEAHTCITHWMPLPKGVQ